MNINRKQKKATGGPQVKKIPQEILLTNNKFVQLVFRAVPGGLFFLQILVRRIFNSLFDAKHFVVDVMIFGKNGEMIVFNLELMNALFMLRNSFNRLCFPVPLFNL